MNELSLRMLEIEINSAIDFELECFYFEMLKYEPLRYITFESFARVLLKGNYFVNLLWLFDNGNSFVHVLTRIHIFSSVYLLTKLYCFEDSYVNSREICVSNVDGPAAQRIRM